MIMITINDMAFKSVMTNVVHHRAGVFRFKDFEDLGFDLLAEAYRTMLA